MYSCKSSARSYLSDRTFLMKAVAARSFVHKDVHVYTHGKKTKEKADSLTKSTAGRERSRGFFFDFAWISF